MEEQNDKRDKPLDALWQAPAMAWVLLACEGLSVVLALAPGLQQDRLPYFFMTSLATQWVAFMTLGVLYLGRHRLGRQRPQRVAHVALVLLVLNTWVFGSLAWFLLRDVWLLSQEGWQGFFLQLTGIALAVGLLALAAFQNHWRGRMHAIRAKQSEVEALQARIRPHFLFNTLNTGAALVHAHPDQAERLLLDLADLFRSALRGPQRMLLSDELSLTRRYLDIEALRFGSRLQLAWDVPADLPDVLVPSLSIQPLAENAIHHGIERLSNGGRVELRVVVTAEHVVVTVSNDIPGIAGGGGGHAVGLASARERVHALTHGRGRVDARVDGQRYVATVTLPLEQ